MAKSIHKTIREAVIEIHHDGTDYVFDVPGWVNEFSEVMSDEAGLVAVARKHECLHGLLHAGLQQLVINIRQKGRPADKKSVTQPMDVDAGQNRIDAYRMKPVPVPGAAKPIQPDDALRALLDSGMTKEELLEKLGMAGDGA